MPVIYHIVWVYSAKDEAWRPVQLEYIVGNRIWDIEYRSKPPKRALTINDSEAELEELRTKPQIKFEF